MNKIGFIGSGNMAQAMISGLANNFPDIHKNIFVSDNDLDKARLICEQFSTNLSSTNIDVLKHSDVIVLAVKPNIYGKVLTEIKDYITNDQIIISIAPGISMQYIEDFFSIPVKVIRTMPNTPVFVGEGMIAISSNEHVTRTELDFVINLFHSIGTVDEIDEKLMDMVPAISGSSPAYVYMFIEALADGAVLQGLSRDKAYKYAAQAVLGAAKMVLETGKHPGELKDQVCSPGGTTIEAVFSLEKNHFRGAIIEAMNACTDKSKNLSKK